VGPGRETFRPPDPPLIVLAIGLFLLAIISTAIVKGGGLGGPFAVFRTLALILVLGLAIMVFGCMTCMEATTKGFGGAH
jgi:hypothetical protein